MKILSVDIGTTAMKIGVFEEGGDDLHLLKQTSRDYAIQTYNDGLFSDIEQHKWQKAFIQGCRDLADLMPAVDIISLSGTTPGLTAMDKSGEALCPAILMLDQRSRGQARYIIEHVGIEDLLEKTANMPVAGGCSLASILWIKDNLPEVFKKTHTFGHSNSFMAKWMTGKSGMDPSSASLTALYNTTQNDMTWNKEIADSFGISLTQLPELMRPYESTGRLKNNIAAECGLKKEPPVLIGGNDAVLAAYSVGIREPGEIFNINGTCEITMVCLPKCYPSKNYNIRTHVIPDRWFSFYVMNAQGKAFEWFHGLFCSEMSADQFFGEFMPAAIDKWLNQDSGVTYVPYLMGSRYSLEPLKAAFSGLTQETSSEELLAAMVRGLCEYQKENLIEISSEIPLKRQILVSGGAVNPALIRAKRKWMRDGEYTFETESSMKGAAMLGRKHLEFSATGASR
ncbi:MAG: FGGY family carbohydrate kinase [Desulfobacterales bacterium]|jgi:sugar (pentulose or hexulose) kinase